MPKLLGRMHYGGLVGCVVWSAGQRVRSFEARANGLDREPSRREITRGDVVMPPSLLWGSALVARVT